MGALDAPVLLFVVENQLVAQGADRLGEVLGDLVGVGPVGGQQPCREAERSKLGQGVDRVRANALARGVQDEAERQLRVAADAFTGLRVTSAMSLAGSDQKTGGVSEDSFLSAPAVVPAGSELDGCEAPPFARRLVPGRNRSGVGADIALPALEQAPAVGSADGDQHQTVTDLLQQLPPTFTLGVRIFPGGCDSALASSACRRLRRSQRWGSRTVVSRSKER
ncbi:hypothetical protein [Streptomyces sp. NPDC058280]|uniref:hypothetical protein n=1 Tax=Streptomyces sp. NPDC058280 TaxID=3346419 RepID=UPI0036EDC1C0